MDVLEAIATKRAVREYRPEPVPAETIRTILDAGRRAQSSRNSQPWHFVVVQERDTLANLSMCGNSTKHVAQAAFAVALVSSTGWTFDIGQTAAYLQLAAWSLGVSSCIATMHKEAEAREALGVPQTMHLEIVIAFGYAARPQPPKGKLGGRRPLAEVVHWDRW